MPNHVEPTITQTTPHGEVTIYAMTLTPGGTYIVVIESRDPRFKADNWGPALEILQERWRSKREEYDERQEYRDSPMGGMIRVDGRFRLYRESLAADGGTGPARRCNHHGRNEFPEFGPHVDPVENLHPLLKFLRSLHPSPPRGDASQGEGGESDQEDGPRFTLEECVRSLTLRLQARGQRAGEPYQVMLQKRSQTGSRNCHRESLQPFGLLLKSS
ncbi:hypothetical protein BO82DRAFT_425735 [Aspergillus uvarum CBS 121591]|uniref:Uncharacterized protein n=1 Tax=Aspergillus uvarum CBS 121591 TaxID=1448315 RepID=A0A319CIW5_9EURO|nr:hypothetical protein BO82DRAFT_425735 [Aspergillus uvarum CBS 121591]PYH85134.1 hypothetical protein BO82DRAFT_425735 [Aspergillus uvarum CBS 121591]